MIPPELKLLLIVGFFIFLGWKFFCHKQRKKSKPLRGHVSITDRGETVKSKAEMRIANVFNTNNVEYQYEKTIVLDTQKLHPDFYLPKYDLYIEYFGWYNAQKKYTDNAKAKKKLYKKHQLKTWYLYPWHYKKLESVVANKIFWLKFWYLIKKIFGIR